jgi:HEAT repeat protein
MPGDETYSDQLRRELYAAIQATWSRAGKIISVLSKVSEHKDTGFIRDLIPLLWAKEEAVVFEVAATLSLLVPRINVENLPDLDANIRAGWPYWASMSNLDGTQMERLKASPSWWCTFAVLASHPSGFVRQAAVEVLGHEETGESLPFLMLRSADWVEPVRVSALNILQQKLARPNFDQLDKCLPLAFRMRDAQRHQPLAILEQIEKLVGSRNDRILDGGYANHSPAFLRYRFKLAKQYGQQPLDQLLDFACKAPNVGVRLLACDWIAEAETPPEVRDKYGKVLLADKIPLVRVRAFWRVANANPEKYSQQIERALLDSSAAVQDTARGAWRMLLRKDALAFYRRAIAQVSLPAGIVAAMRGLRAEGKLDDEALVRPFLQHRSAKVKKEALRTLVAWNSPDAPNLLHEDLRSKSPSYSKGAAALLSTRPNLLAVPLIKELLVNPRHADARKIAMWLFAVMPKWSSLPLILTAYSLDSYREQADRAFKDWNKHYNRNQSAPTKTEAKEAVKAFTAIAGLPLAKDRNLIWIISDLEKLARS